MVLGHVTLSPCPLKSWWTQQTVAAHDAPSWCNCTLRWAGSMHTHDQSLWDGNIWNFCLSTGMSCQLRRSKQLVYSDSSSIGCSSTTMDCCWLGWSQFWTVRQSAFRSDFLWCSRSNHEMRHELCCSSGNVAQKGKRHLSWWKELKYTTRLQ